MWQEFEPVFSIDIAILGSSVGPYALLSRTGFSVIWSFEHVDPSAAEAGAEADADADDDGDDAPADDEDDEDAAGDEDGDADGAAADDAPFPRPTTMSTMTTTMSRITPATVARRRQ
jgi:cobalamin biosynthesis protein CobT